MKDHKFEELVVGCSSKSKTGIYFLLFSHLLILYFDNCSCVLVASTYPDNLSFYIFNKKMFKILVHPQSLVHAIVKFDNGLTKLLIHDTNMKIPIFNTIYDNPTKKVHSKKLDMAQLNNLTFKKIDLKKFPSINVLKFIPKKISLFETVLVSCNDELVDLFLKNKIKFWEIHLKMKKILNYIEFAKFKRLQPNNTKQIYKLSEYVRLKTRSLSINSKK